MRHRPPQYSIRKWNSSKDAGYDIGMERAIREWLQRNYLVWAPQDAEAEEPAAAAPTAPQ